GPMLLQLPIVNIPQTGLNAAGLTLDALYLAAATAIMRPRSVKELLFALGAVLSPASWFALDRANLDEPEFILFAAATGSNGVLWRLVPYWLYILGCALQFYPLVRLASALRERMAVFLSLAVASLSALAIYLAVYGKDLVRISSLSAADNYYSPVTGAP